MTRSGKRSPPLFISTNLELNVYNLRCERMHNQNLMFSPLSLALSFPAPFPSNWFLSVQTSFCATCNFFGLYSHTRIYKNFTKRRMNVTFVLQLANVNFPAHSKLLRIPPLFSDHQSKFAQRSSLYENSDSARKIKRG